MRKVKTKLLNDTASSRPIRGKSDKFSFRRYDFLLREFYTDNSFASEMFLFLQILFIKHYIERNQKYLLNVSIKMIEYSLSSWNVVSLRMVYIRSEIYGNYILFLYLLQFAPTRNLISELVLAVLTHNLGYHFQT